MDKENQQFYYMCMNHLENSPKSKKVKIISTPESEAQVVADFIMIKNQESKLDLRKY